MRKEMKIRVFEAFAGYGSQSLALERLKRNFPNFDYTRNIDFGKSGQ